MPLSTISNMSSPTPPSRYPDLPVPRNQSMSEFEVEHTMLGKVPVASGKTRRRGSDPEQDAQLAYRASISAIVNAKARPFALAGRVPMDPAHLTLFFRSQSGISHSLDFPIDLDVDMPPAMDVLISSCMPHTLEGFTENETLFYPPNLPLTATLELANHPILEAVRNTLFPSLPLGHYLTAVRDKLEIWPKGNAVTIQPRPADSRVATVVVTLPVKFRGGALAVRSPDGMEEKYYGRGGKGGDMEWTAIMSDCEWEIQTVRSGCRVTISYAIQLKTFGAAGIQPDPLITPSDAFLDMLSSVLNMSRGRKIAFYLTGEYGVNPGEVLAESLVPSLKGGDSILYHALRLYKLTPELRWTAGGFIWAVDQSVEFVHEGTDSPITPAGRQAPGMLGGGRVPPLRGPFSSASEPGEDELEDLRTRVIKSGAIPISEADISILSDSMTFPGIISKERVPFVSTLGDIEKLVVNVLMVIYVP